MLNKEEFRKYAEKHRINECAEYFGVSSSYVSFYAKKNNITVAKKNDKKKHVRKEK